MTSFSYFHYLVRSYLHSSVEEVNLKTSTNKPNMDLKNFSKSGELNPWSDADSALSPLLNVLNIVEKLGYVQKVMHIFSRSKNKDKQCQVNPRSTS